MTWANDILTGLKAPQSQNNIQKLAAWNACEGNLAGQSGLGINNPFNTTLNCCGGVSVNSAGVKRYPNIASGVSATLQTLQAPRYALVVANLRGDGSGSTFATAVGSSGWGTSGSCIAQSLGTALAQPNTPVNGAIFTYAQLEAVWIQAGGNSQEAPMAAAIAMAESGGNSNASHTNSNGSVDRGLWQINSTNGSGSTFDVMTNARTAISMSNNGTNWRPWCTAYSDGACGTSGGTYEGNGAPYRKYLKLGVAPDYSAPLNATNAAANQPATELAAATKPFDPLGIGPILQWVFITTLTPVIQAIAGALGVAAGGSMMILGIYQIIGHPGSTEARRGAEVFFPESRVARVVAGRGVTGGERTARIRQQTAASTEAGRRQSEQARSNLFGARTAEAQRRRDFTMRSTETTTTRTQKGNTTTYKTTRRLLNDEAGSYTPPGNAVARRPGQGWRRG
jgi:hypothetical protein